MGPNVLQKKRIILYRKTSNDSVSHYGNVFSIIYHRVNMRLRIRRKQSLPMRLTLSAPAT